MDEIKQTRKCYRCKKTKDFSEFSKDKYHKCGRTYDCKECRNKVYKKWSEKNPDKIKEFREKTKEYRKEYYSRPEIKENYRYKALFRDFGITKDQFEKILRSQDSVCAICKEKEKCIKNKYLSVDHCHKTGKIRGLLCSACNTAIGLMRDNVFLMQGAIEYLKNNNQQIRQKNI